MDSKTLRAELRDDQNHLQWMELVILKEAEMNRDAPRRKDRLNGEAHWSLTHIDETVVEGSMGLGVFWPEKYTKTLRKTGFKIQPPIPTMAKK